MHCLSVRSPPKSLTVAWRRCWSWLPQVSPCAFSFSPQNAPLSPLPSSLVCALPAVLHIVPLLHLPKGGLPPCPIVNDTTQQVDSRENVFLRESEASPNASISLRAKFSTLCAVSLYMWHLMANYSVHAFCSSLPQRPIHNDRPLEVELHVVDAEGRRMDQCDSLDIRLSSSLFKVLRVPASVTFVAEPDGRPAPVRFVATPGGYLSAVTLTAKTSALRKRGAADVASSFDEVRR